MGQDEVKENYTNYKTKSSFFYTINTYICIYILYKHIQLFLSAA